MPGSTDRAGAYQVRLTFTDGTAATLELRVEAFPDGPCVLTALPD